MKVFVSGAGGRTGQLVLQKLREHPDIQALGLVRRPEQADGDVIVGDILKPETYEEAISKCDALVILTSAMPKSRPSTNPSDPPMEWYFDPGQEPEQVDWIGQRNQIDLAQKHKLQRVVLVSSMGVTKPEHPLNRIGNGKILFWKRTAEDYLRASGLDYTVIHPGGLIDEPGGKRELVVGTNDSLLESKNRTIPRADVAELVVQSLLLDEAINKDFDVVSLPEGEGTVTRSFDVLFEQI